MVTKNEVETQNKGTIVKVQQKAGIATFLARDDVRQNVVSVVGEKNATRFISSVVSAVQTNQTLAMCTNSSILSAALLGEALQLSPSPQLGQFYMVPYDNSKDVVDPETGKNKKVTVKEAQFQIGYKGYIQLAIRSGQYRKIVVSDVKEGEVGFFNPITEEFGMNPVLDMKKRAELMTVGYYGMFELMNGFRKELYWSKEQMEQHAKTYSKGYASDLRKGNKYTFWSKDFGAMAKKTLIRQLINKWGVMSIEMQKAYEADMAVIDENGTARYVDNTQDIEEVVAEEIEENANSVSFEAIEEKPEPPTMPKAQAKEKEPVKVESEQELPDFMKTEG